MYKKGGMGGVYLDKRWECGMGECVEIEFQFGWGFLALFTGNYKEV